MNFLNVLTFKKYLIRELCANKNILHEEEINI